METNTTPTMTLNQNQIDELVRLKAYFPYRIVFGIIDKDTGGFEAQVRTTKAAMNNAMRKGHRVFMLSK